MKLNKIIHQDGPAILAGISRRILSAPIIALATATTGLGTLFIESPAFGLSNPSDDLKAGRHRLRGFRRCSVISGVASSPPSNKISHSRLVKLSEHKGNIMLKAVCRILIASQMLTTWVAVGQTNPPDPVVQIPACAGIITAPFVTNSGGYISQRIQTGVADGGHAVYAFSIPNAGDYLVSATLNAPNASANSFFVNMDSDPADPLMIWDIPVHAGFTNQTVSWRGNGTTDANQFVPKTFSLSAGVHQLVVVGREAGTQLSKISVAPFGARPAAPAAPQNLRVVAASP